MEKEPLSIPRHEKIRDAYLLRVSSGAIAVMDAIVSKGSTADSDMVAVGLASICISIVSGVKLISYFIPQGSKS